MQSVRRKIALQVVVSNLNIVANFGLAVVLARLLSPDDIGVFSMSAVLIAIAHTFRDFGVTAYLKREKELTDQTIRTARGLLYTTSWSMAVAMYLSAHFWARYFNEPRVEDVVHVLALGFVFIPFGSIPQALLARELDVIQSAKVNGVSSLVYVVASVALALLGFKHMTMAWANLVNILVTGLAYNIFLGRRLPLMPSLQGWRAMVSFGSANVLTALCKVVNTSLPDLVLGRLSVAANVGLFSRATSTVNMVSKAIEPSVSFFTLPYMARVYHASGDVSPDYVRAGSIINCILFPAFAWVALVAHDIVLFLYGEPWLGAVPAIPWLCAAAAISTLFTLSSQTITGVGKPFAAVLPLMVLIIGKLISIAIFYDGTLEGFSIAMVLGEALSIPAYIYINTRLLNVRMKMWFFDTIKIIIVVVVAAVFLSVLLTMLPQEASVFLRLFLSFPAMVVFCTIGFLLLNLPVASEFRNVYKIISNGRR